MPGKGRPFKKGQSGNPKGRPKGSVGGRQLFLQMIDRVLAEDTTLTGAEDALRKMATKHPWAFYGKLARWGLLPKEFVLTHTTDEKMPLRIEIVQGKPEREGGDDGADNA